MRDYGKVPTSFWHDSVVRSMSDDGRLLALYLLTCDHNTLAGVCRLPIAYAASDLKWTPERVTAALNELTDVEYAVYCHSTQWVWVCRYIDDNPLENPNVAKAAQKIAYSVPVDCIFVGDFSRDLQKRVSDLRVSKPLRRGSEGVGEPFGKPFETSRCISSSSSSSSSNQIHTQSVCKSSTDADAPENGLHTLGGSGVETSEKANGLNGHGPEPLLPVQPPPPEPAGFVAIKAAYPARSGSHRWADALIEYRENLRLGFTDAQMLEGVQRYAAYVRAEAIEGLAIVTSARVFLGPNRGFLESWAAGKKPTAADRWLREQELKDAQH